MAAKAGRIWARWWHRVIGGLLFVLALGVTTYTAAAPRVPSHPRAN